MFYFDYVKGKRVMKSDLLKVNHFFTTRETVIKSKEDSMQPLVDENIGLFCEYFEIEKENFITPSQTHTSHVELCEKGKKSYPDTDGLVLTNKEQAVYLNFADCTPIIFYDSVLNTGAVCHAGWRGTAGQIAVKTVAKMLECGSNIADIKAAIGPAIGICCYNVGQEVFEKLKSTVNDFNGLYEIRSEETFVDLKGINARQLEESGVKQIDICPYCTSCNNDLFFSYRKENATTNRHSAILYLN